jgi:hypothetical protein
MSSSTQIAASDTATEAVAPWWHTVLVPLAVISLASWYQHGLANAHIPGLGFRVSGYITVLLAEWLQVLLIWLALKNRGLPLSGLIAGRWETVGSFFRPRNLHRISHCRSSLGRAFGSSSRGKRQYQPCRYHVQDLVRTGGMASARHDLRRIL